MAESGTVTFSRRVAFTMAVRLSIAACSLSTGLIVARGLGTYGAGVIAALTVITMLAINIASLGLPSAVTYMTARRPEMLRPILIGAIFFALAAGATVGGAIILAGYARPGLLGQVPVKLLAIASFAIPFQMIAVFALSLYLGLERIRSYNLLELAMPVLMLANAFVTIMLIKAGVESFVFVGTLLNITVACVALVHLLKTTEPAANPIFDRSLFNEIFRSGAKFFVAMAAVLIILRGDLLIVNYYRGPDEAGVYAVATQFATFLHMIPNVISTLLFPRVAGTRDVTGQLTCRVTRNSVVLMLVLCTAFVPVAFILPVLYGPAFSPATVQFLILLPGVFLLGIETILVQHFSGQGLPAIIPSLWVGALVLSIGLNVALVPGYGAVAAASVSSLTYGLMFVLVALLFRRRTGRTLSETFLVPFGELRQLLNFRPLSVKAVSEKG